MAKRKRVEPEVEILPPEPEPEPEPKLELVPPVQTHKINTHSGGDRVTREELALIEPPSRTRTHFPVRHIDIINELEQSLSYRGIRVVEEEFVVHKDGMRMFSILGLDHEFSGCRFCIGVKNANDK